MTRSPRRRRAKPSVRPARSKDSNSDYETRSPRKRSVKSVWAWFIAITVLPICMISGIHLHVELTPALLSAAVAALLGAHGKPQRPWRVRPAA